jgi:hypothetical protein
MSVDYTARLVAGYILPHTKYKEAVENAIAAGFAAGVVENSIEKLDEYKVNSDYILSSDWYAVAGPGEANRIRPIPTEEDMCPHEMIKRMAIAMGIETSYGMYLMLRVW